MKWIRLSPAVETKKMVLSGENVPKSGAVGKGVAGMPAEQLGLGNTSWQKVT